MRTWIFRETSYPKLLAKLVAEATPSRGMIAKVATAVGCQRSYVSQVLHGKAHFSPEQAWSAACFFNLSEDESKYFIHLVDLARAATPAYREHVQKRLAELRRDGAKISKRFTKTQEFTASEAIAYYGSWLPAAVHLLTSIPRFQDPARMASRLGVALADVLRVLEQLASRGVVRHAKPKWEFVRAPGYLPTDSPLVFLHHQNWRQLAVEDAKNPRSLGMHYTMVQSLSAEDFEKLKALVLDFITQTKAIAEPSAAEVLTALNLDFFQPRG